MIGKGSFVTANDTNVTNSRNVASAVPRLFASSDGCSCGSCRSRLEGTLTRPPLRSRLKIIRLPDTWRPPWTSPPFVLLAQCCAWPPTDARDAVISRSAADIGERAFVALAKRHRVEGLAHAALARVQARLTESLAARAGEIARQGLIQAAESVRLQTAFDAAAVPSLMLKGAALEILAYGRLGLKSAWDIDILVAPANASRAVRILEAAGYRLTNPAGRSGEAFDQWTTLSKECVFVSDTTSLVAELHWRLVDGDLLPGIGVASPAQTVDVAPGVGLRTLAADDLVAYLTAHGASHGWSRLKWLADLHALLPNDPTALERLYRRAVTLGAGTCPALALRLCRRLFNLQIGDSLWGEIERDLKSRLLERIALSAMSGAGGREIAERPLIGDLVLTSHLLFGRGWAWRWAEFQRQWVSVHDQTHVRLPSPLRFFYTVIRLPLWLWRRLKRL